METPNIVDVETTENVSVSEWQVIDGENHQQENFEQFMKYFDSLNRKDKRTMLNKKLRCKKLHTRVGAKRWSERQINNRKLQCKS